MYKDPEEREQQIKAISSAFRELADGILPQLRRARLIANYQLIGRDDDQIMAQISTDASKLSVEELLYGATLYDNDVKGATNAYQKAVDIYPNDARAYNNLAALAYQQGNYELAKQWLVKAQRVNANLPEASANMGLLALQNGDLANAENLIAKGSSANGVNEILGNLYLAQGKYVQAEQQLSQVNTNSAALAQIMNKNYSGAAKTLKNVQNPDGMTEYLKAVLASRTGKAADAATALKAALAKDASLRQYADKDLELKK
jgi:Flp pilus assembly protein TadD